MSDYIEFKVVRDSIEVTYRVNDVDICVDELFNEFKLFLAGMGYHSNNIEALGEL